MTVPILQAASLSALDGLRHAFFTRGGGVSTGVYASLNSGIGSQDAPENVAENRARMAGAMAVAAERLLTCYQVHSPTVVVVDEPWCGDARPRADALVTRVAVIARGI
jgi:copper oxidase (laccase) domain-containing protein